MFCRAPESFLPDRIKRRIYPQAGNFTNDDAILAALLYAGNIIACRIGQGNGSPVYSINPDPTALRIIDLDSKTLETFEDEVRELLRHEQERLW